MEHTVEVPGALLGEVGRVLFGQDEWAGPMAQALGLNPRTVQRWRAAASADQPVRVSRSLVGELAALVQARARAADQVAPRLAVLTSAPAS